MIRLSLCAGGGGQSGFGISGSFYIPGTWTLDVIDTLPKVIWPNLRYTLSPIVAAASGVGLATTLALLWSAWRVMKWTRARR